ncbi:MAG: family permease [Blastococcus sp.]|jgi:amino acid transporter|nr:family permease [Blastococcus sp.]
MSRTLPEDAANPSGGLAKGQLRTIDAVAISVSVLSPGMAMQLNTGGMAGVAGGSTPLAMLIGGIACLALAFVVIGFTRRMAAAGYAYTYVSRSLGKRPGFLAGWLYGFGMACFVPMTMAAVGFLLADLLGLATWWWIVFFVIGMVLLLALSIIRIHTTTRVQLAVGVLTVVVLLIVCVVVTAKGGLHGQTGAPFTFGKTASGGFNGVFYGLILGITSYIGFETAADFGEETANPRRAVPIAILASVIFAILLYVWTTYATTIGYGANELAKDPTPWVNGGVAGVATQYIGSFMGKLVEIGALLSAFIVCVACATASARTLFAMGREGVIPTWFSETHPRYKTPVNATVVVAIAATVVAVIVGYGFPNADLGQPFTVYALMATIGSLAVILVYIALCVGAVPFFRRHARFNVLVHGVIPAIGAVLFAAAWYGSVYPVPPAPIRAAPYVVLVWLLCGFAMLAYLSRKRPDAIERIGSILGEEGGVLVEALEEA